MRLPFSFPGNGPIFKTPKKGVDNMRKAIVFMILTAVCAALYANGEIRMQTGIMAKA